MSLPSNLIRGLRSLFRKRAIESEMDEELSAFVEASTADKLRRGMKPDEAAHAARAEMGSANAVKHHIRSGAWETVLENFWRDLWYGVRTLMRSPGFTAIAVLTLALGIGANTAIFQLLDAVRLRDLPVASPSELTVVRMANRSGWRGNQATAYPALNNPLWEYIRDHQRVFSQVLAWSPTNLGITEDNHEQLVQGLWVSGNFFNALGVRPALGRLFASSDDRPGCGAAGVVLSHAFWQGQFGGNAQAVGRTLIIARHAVPILGVTPPGFSGPEVGRSFDVAVPICSQSTYWTEGNWLDSSTDWWLTVMGRLKPGDSLSTANAGLESLSPSAFQASLRKDYPTENVRDYLHFKLVADSAPGGVSWLRDEYESPLWMLLGLAGFVLLIACANLANLMLARGSTRVREFAVRLSLGATRGRLIRQLLWESLLLVLFGTVLGLVLARVLGKSLIALLSTQGDSLFLEIRADWRVLGFMAMLAAMTVLFFGLFPAFRATRLAPSEAMKSGSPRTGATHDSNRLRSGLVVTQVALSLVLVTGAVLFARTLANLLTVDAGFREDNILIAQLDLSKLRLPVERRLPVKKEIVDRLRSVAAVEAAAEVGIVPVSGSGTNNVVWADGQNRQSGFDSNFNWTGSGYFKTLGTPLLAGRDFDEQDTPNSPKVAIVNQEFARRFGRGANPVGLRIRREATPHEPETAFEIVGLVKNTKYHDLREKPVPIIYLQISQDPNPDSFEQVMIHSALPLAALTSSLKLAVVGINPAIDLDFRVFKTQIQESLLPERLMAALSGFFGILAALLTAVGLYGVISFLVARRTHEIGIRMALGAGKSHILSSILRETLMLTVLGVGVGLPITFCVARIIASMLFGVKPYDPVALAFAVLALCGVSLAAAYIPARRAAAVDPMVALREE
ncbi:MAG: ABC transporter permease [Terracidiphilus sp.]